ncbi:MAG: hypothetical protein H0U75_04570 [Legionella sp.]|nr:hypothetical protein [Legionella sp.]
MLIKIDDNSTGVAFEAVALVEYLESFSPMEKKSVHISITQGSTDDYETMLNFLLRSDLQVNFQIHLSEPASEHWNTLFETLFLAKQQEYFEQVNHQRLAAARPAEIKKEYRKLKLLQGQKGPKLPIQMQQQQQQQQQQQTAQVQPKIRERPATSTSPNNPISSTQLGTLINEKNIETELGEFSRTVFKPGDVDLITIWNNLVGLNSNLFRDTKVRITDVSKEVMQDIIRNHREFSYGIVPHNLPQNLILQETLDGKNVLSTRGVPNQVITLHSADRLDPETVQFLQPPCYVLARDALHYIDSNRKKVEFPLTPELKHVFPPLDNVSKNASPDDLIQIQRATNHEIASINQEPPNPLTLTLIPKPKLVASLNQFMLRLFRIEGADSSPIRKLFTPEGEDLRRPYQGQFNILNDVLAPGDRKKAFLFFIEKLGQNQPDINKTIENALNPLSLTNSQYKGLLDLLIFQGESGVLLLLDQIQRLKADDSATKVFIENSDNFASLISEEGQNQLNFLKKLDKSQGAWWDSLIKQHQDADSVLNFDELTKAYRFFLEELSGLGIKTLPPVCPIQNIKHMKSALDRVLYILKNANDPKEQLLYLNIDFSSTGPYVAMPFNLVSKEMDLTLSPLVGDNIFDSDAFKALLNKKCSIKIKENCFQAGLSLNISNSIGNLLNDNKLLTDIEKSHFLIGYSRWLEKYENHYKEESYYINEAEKQLNQLCDKKKIDYQPPTRQNYFKVLKEFPNQGIVNYYRYVGKYSAYPLEEYQQIDAMSQVSEDYEVVGDAQEWVGYSFKERAYILGVVALLTSGKDVNTLDPVSDAKRLMQSLQRLSKFNKDDAVGFNVFEGLEFLTGINPSILPSLNQLSQVIEFFNQLSLESYVTYYSAFNFLKKFSQNFDKSLRIFKNLHIKVQAQENQNGEPIEGYEFGANLVLLCELLSDTGSISLILFKKYERDNFVTILTLIQSDIKNYADSINLATGFSRLDASLRKELLEILAEINIDSLELPTYEGVSALLSQIKVQESTILKEKNPVLKRKLLLEQVFKAFPRTTFGPTPEVSSQDGLVLALRSANRELDLKEALKEIRDDNGNVKGTLVSLPMGNLLYEAVKGKLTQLDAPIQSYTEALYRNPYDYAEILNTQDTLDKACSDFINTLPFKSLFPTILQKFGPDKPELAEFAKNGKILVLLKDHLEAYSQAELYKRIILLQLGDTLGGLRSDLYRNIPKLDLNKKTSVALEEYNQKLIQINSFINGLIRIKNRETGTNYQKIKELLDNNTIIGFEYLLQIIQVLEIPAPICATERLNFIFTIVSKHGMGRLPQALSQLRLLISLDKPLPEALYRTLFKLSFEHNMANNTPFPLEEIINLKTLKNNHNSDAEALFETVVQLIDVGASDKVSSLIALTANTLKRLSPTHPHIVSVLNNLLKKCKLDAQLDSTLQVLTCLHALPTDTHFNNLLEIITKTAASNANIESIQQLLVLIQSKPNFIGHLASLFTYPPYPKVDILLVELAKADADLALYIENYDSDPKNARSEKRDGKNRLLLTQTQILEKQFSVGRIEDVVAGVHELLADSKLSLKQQFDLAQQILFINALGQKPNIKICGKTLSKPLTQIPRDDLRHLSNLLIERLQTNLSPEEMKRTQLQFITVLREIYFRTTGKLPKTTQLLALLLAIEYPGNLLEEISTGEGKNLITAMHATFQWAKGNRTVNVGTANRNLVTQDYIEKGNVDFFTFLGIRSNHIRSDSPPGSYQVGGINYSTVEDLSLYCSRAKLEGEDLLNFKGKRYTNDLVLEESDSTTLDNKKLLNWAMVSPSLVDDGSNPHAFIYPLVNQFIDENADFRNITLPLIWDNDKDCEELRKFLYDNTTASQQHLLQDTLSYQYNQWINSALEAKNQVLDSDFLIDTKTFIKDDVRTTISTAVPIDIEGNPQRGVTFKDGVHQFLHARLGQSFPIDPEFSVVDSQSTQTYIHKNYAEGRIIAVTGTGGDTNELLEQGSKFGLTAVRIPTHDRKRLIEHETRITSSKAFLTEIKKVLDNRVNKNNPQMAKPVLLLCEDIIHANTLLSDLQRSPNKKGPPNQVFQVITGAEDDQEMQAKIINAGKPNVITISPATKRGTDIQLEEMLTNFGKTQPDYPLLVLNTHLESTLRGTKQAIGRTARNGLVGEYIAVYDDAGFTHKHLCGGSLLKMNKNQRKAALNKMQQAMTEEAAVERHYIQAVAQIQQVMLAAIDDWQQLLHLESGADKIALDKSFFSMRESLISELSKSWENQLAQSDPKKQFPNVFIRRDAATGTLDTQALDQALMNFEKNAFETIWETNKIWLTQKSVQLQNPNNKLRADYYLKDVSLKDQLKLLKMNTRQEKKMRHHEEKEAVFQLAQALDEGEAMLRYGELTSDEILNCQEQSNTYQLSLVRKAFNTLVDTLPLSQVIKTHLQIEFKGTESIHAQSNDIMEKFSRFTEHFTNAFVKNKHEAVSKMQPIWLAYYNLFPKISYDMQMLKPLHTVFTENLINQITLELTQTFSWADKKNRSIFGFNIERGALKRAAIDILNACTLLKEAPTEDEKQLKTQQLFKLLKKHQGMLDGVWIVRHKNAVKVINNVVSSLENIIPEELRHEKQVEIKGGHYIAQFTSNFYEISKKIPHTNRKWVEISAEIPRILDNKTTPYVLYEIKHRLGKHLQNEPANSSLIPPLRKLIQNLELSLKELNQKQELGLSIEPFLETKTKQLQNVLHSKIPELKSLAIEQGHTGFNTYYELQVEGPCEHELFDDFIKYNSPLDILKKKLGTAQDELKESTQTLQAMNITLNDIANTWPKIVNSNGLPEALTSQIESLNTLFTTDGPLNADHISDQKLRQRLMPLIHKYNSLVNLSYQSLTPELKFEDNPSLSSQVQTFAMNKAQLSDQIQKRSTQSFANTWLKQTLSTIKIIDSPETLLKKDKQAFEDFQSTQLQATKQSLWKALCSNLMCNSSTIIKDYELKQSHLQHKVDFFTTEIKKCNQTPTKAVSRFNTLEDLLKFEDRLQQVTTPAPASVGILPGMSN